MINFKHQQTSSSDQSGFTIIESLVALLVAAILLAAIGPVIVLSVATRVQAKRIDLATSAAKTYIDGVKSGTIAPPDFPITGTTDIFAVAAYAPPSPVGSLTCGTGTGYCTLPATNLYCISLDGNSCSTTNTRNFVIQAFRYNKGTTTNSSGVSTNVVDPTKGYQLAVRVYRADGFKSDGGPLKATRNPTEADKPNKQATFAGGTGDRKTPLVEMTTEISNNSTSFDDFCNRLRPNPSPTPSPSPTPQSQC